jgi:hypothetical protein
LGVRIIEIFGKYYNAAVSTKNCGHNSKNKLHLFISTIKSAQKITQDTVGRKLLGILPINVPTDVTT